MGLLTRAKVLAASVLFRQKTLNRWAHMRLPSKRLAACVLLFDDADRLLVLKTTYRREWLVPGGVVERDESPWLGARREVQEEIGLVLDGLRFAAMDWRPSDNEYDDSLHFVFDGGVLSARQQAAICPDGVEIADYRFADPSDAESLLEPHLWRRIQPYWRDRRIQRPLVLNRGQPDGETS